MAGGHAGHEYHADPDGAEDHRASHVRLDEDEAGRNGCHDERDGEYLDLMYMCLPIGEIARKGDDDEELGDLRGLDLLPGEREPAPRAVDGVTDEEHSDEHEDGDGVETDGHLAKDSVVEPGDGEGDPDAQGSEDKLLC